MRHFDLDQLRTFAAVVDAGSLTAGAQRVHLSQSAVSEQVRKLEEGAGQALLWRAKAGVAITPAGERLLAHARRLLALSEAAWRDLHGVTLDGELRLGVTDYFRPLELMPLLARLGEHHPGVRLRIAVQKSGEVEAAHARGEIDVGLSMRLAGTPGAKPMRGSLMLRREPLHWMAAQGYKLAPGEPVRLLALPETCSLHQYTVGLLRRRRVPFDVVHTASGVAGLQAALAAGLGVACLNASALPPGAARMAQTPRLLPALPDASFYLLPLRAGDSGFVQEARDLLAREFA